MTDGLRRGRRVKYAPVPEDLLFDSSISSHAKVVWGLLDRRIDNREESDTEGTSFPGRGWLSEHMSVSVPTVDRAIKELTSSGWVTVERPCGGRRNLYTVHDEAQQVITGDEQRSSPVMSSRSSPVMSTKERAQRNDPKRTKPTAATAPQPADGQLDLGASARGKPRERKPEDIEATRVTRAIWDGCDPKPVESFVGVRAIVKRFLVEHTADEVIAAGVAAPCLTVAAIRLQINQARQPAAPRGRRSGRLQGAEFDEAWDAAAERMLNTNGRNRA